MLGCYVIANVLGYMWPGPSNNNNNNETLQGTYSKNNT